MTIDDDFHSPPLEEQTQKFKNAMLSLFMRWYEESDLDDEMMGEASIETLNKFFGEGTVEFEGDEDLLE